MTRTSGRWKESPRKAALGELQDELMGTRLREAQAQAELHRLRQRVVELETQVGWGGGHQGWGWHRGGSCDS